LRNTRLTQRFRLTPYLTGAYTALNANEAPTVDRVGQIGIEDFKAQITTNLTADPRSTPISRRSRTTRSG